MAVERKKSEIAVESEGFVEKVVAQDISLKKKKKKKNREDKDGFAGEDGEIAARERERLGDDAVVKKKPKKKKVDSEAEDDGKRSKKKNKEKKVDSEHEEDVKESKKINKERKVDSEAEEDVKESKRKNKERKVDSEAEEDVKKSKERKVDDNVGKSKKKKKGIDSEAEVGVKISKKKSKEFRDDDRKKRKEKKTESGGDEIGSFEENQRDEELLDAKRETRKRKRDDNDLDLGAEEHTEKSDEEVKRKSKKKKQNVDSKVEANNDSSKKEKKQTQDSEAEENNSVCTEDAKKERKEKQNCIKDVTTPSSKSTKKVKFSDQVEVFPSKDEESEEEEEEVELVKRKLFTKKEDKLIKKAVFEYIENHALGDEDEGVKKVMQCKQYPEIKGCWKEIGSALPWRDQTSVYGRAHTLFKAGSLREPTSEDEESEEEEEVELVKGKRFTKEEDELVKKAVLEYIENHALGDEDEGVKKVMQCKQYPEIKGCWKEIGSALPWREHNSVYHRAHTIFEAGSQGQWTKEDFELLKEYHKKHGNDWRTLADAMGKHRKHVKDAWRRIRLNQNKGHWSREEYQTLYDLVNTDIKMKVYREKHAKHGMLRDNIPWMAISDELGTRDHTVCCVKWYDQLTSPMVASGAWANVDDYRLMDELTKLDAACVDDVDWDTILENRDGEACRKRWNQMVRHIGIPGTKTFAEQVDILSERYCPDLAEHRENFDNRPYDPED